MSNVEYGEQGFTRDDTYTQGDFDTVREDSQAGELSRPGVKSDGWWTNNNINARTRSMVGNKQVTGYYNPNNGGYRTESNAGSVSIWMQE